MKNSTDLGNNINYSEEIDLHVDFKRTVRNSQQNSKYLSKRKPPLIVNVNLENQKIKQYFLKYQYFQLTNFGATRLQKKTDQENILIFSDSIPSRIKIYDFNKALVRKNG